MIDSFSWRYGRLTIGGSSWDARNCQTSGASRQAAEAAGPAPVEYPESDDKPMSETPIHWRATVDFAHPPMDRYAASPDAYVAATC